MCFTCYVQSIQNRPNDDERYRPKERKQNKNKRNQNETNAQNIQRKKIKTKQPKLKYCTAKLRPKLNGKKKSWILMSLNSFIVLCCGGGTCVHNFILAFSFTFFVELFLFSAKPVSNTHTLFIHLVHQNRAFEMLCNVVVPVPIYKRFHSIFQLIKSVLIN